MTFKNLNGTTRNIFSMGLGVVKVLVGNISGTGLLQGQDADKRTLRDLVQYCPRWLIPENYTQLATHHEVHQLSGTVLTLESGACYELDEGAIVIL